MRGILIRFINQLFIFFVLLGFSDVRANECKNLFSYVSQLSAEEFVGIAEASAIKHVTCPGCTTDMVKRTQINFLEKMDTAKIFILENEVKLITDSDGKYTSELASELMQGNLETFNAYLFMYRAALKRHEAYFGKFYLFKNEISRRASNKSYLKRELKKDEEFAATFEEQVDRTLDYMASLYDSFKNLGLNNTDSFMMTEFLYNKLKRAPFAQDLGVMAIQSYLESMDTMTTYMPPVSFGQFNDMKPDKKVRIGVAIMETPKGLLIQQVIEGSLAEEFGFHRGDIITKIDNVSLGGLSFSEAQNLISGPIDSVSVFEVKRSDKFINIKLKRKLKFVENPRISSKVIQKEDGLLGVVKLESFYEGSAREVFLAINELMVTHNIKGLVLDLRSNGGGLLNECVAIASIFLDPGVVGMVSENNDRKTLIIPEESDPFFKLPLVVMVDRHSASASEMLAGALKDRGRAIVVGSSRSFGKGTVQSTFGLNGGAGLKITTGMFFTPSGKSPEFQGVSSDIIIPGPNATEKSDQMEKHRYALPGMYLPPQMDGKSYVPTMADIIHKLKMKSSERVKKNIGLTSEEISDVIQNKADYTKYSELQLEEAANVLHDFIGEVRAYVVSYLNSLATQANTANEKKE